MSGALVRYDAMCHAIAAAYEVDEVKDIRDKAIALEKYCQQARNLEAERRAREIRLRAERKAGELLAKRDMHGGDRRSRSAGPILKPLGISPDQSSQWQRLAEVPAEEFEEALADEAWAPSTTGIIERHQAVSRPPVHDAVEPAAIWLWGELREFEREGILGADPETVMATMFEHMRATVRELAPQIAAWLGRIK